MASKRSFDGRDMLAIALIPDATIRDHTNRPLDLTKRRPESRELQPLDPNDETRASLLYLDKWATTFLREDSGFPPASFVYSQQARVQKWVLIRHLYKIIHEDKRYCGISFESCLWSRAGPDGFLPVDVFVSSIIGAFQFERSLRMEGRLRRLFKCFEGAEANKVDYREAVACMLILESSKEVAEKTRVVLMRLYDLWAGGKGRTKTTDRIRTLHAMRLIGIASESDRDLESTRGRFVHALGIAAPQFGISPQADFLPQTLFNYIIDNWKPILENFRETCWNRLTDDMRLNFLGKQEDDVAERYTYIDEKIKMKKAIEMFQGSLAKKSWTKWLAFYKYYREQNNRRLYILYRRSRKLMKRWRDWSVEKKKHRQMGFISCRMRNMYWKLRLFVRWKRWVANLYRIRVLTFKTSGAYARLGEGLACLRTAERTGSLRLAFADWREDTVFAANWAYAIRFEKLLRKRLHIRAWRKHVASRIEIYKRNEEARNQQRMIKDMMKEFEDMDSAMALAAEEEKLKMEQDLKDARAKEKAEKMYWAQQRVQAEKNSNKKYILEIQRQEKAKRTMLGRKRLKEKFNRKWLELEAKLADQAKKEKRKWLRNREQSKYIVEKRFAELKVKFESAPTSTSAESVEHERQLTSIANIAIVYIEGHLFATQQLMCDFVLSFDQDGDGYIGPDELMHLTNCVENLNLSANQIREVFSLLDMDNDGIIAPEEFEQQARIMEKYCGTLASPWKMYVDPDEKVNVLHNLQTGERIFDYEMKYEKLRKINEDNLVAEAEYLCRKSQHKARDDDW
eukprot:CAMPEP_0114347284 /NCGR_PEP_ID=MMETSP0101-20121206/13777_1 /TAXON_ID=38822 ORGANISM="Pteridomonas danica, Strain PT" /NCGR_SAMPLE_ID=MMETSP0101 /ASSEMBLY_ACC=CAM_ASM_000211 /LENGTH=794 /DNA_ID=CAMNT_0001484501 /DNA_START=13 /DNA_END=2394 /DNA_ORIENTATION=+